MKQPIFSPREASRSVCAIVRILDIQVGSNVMNPIGRGNIFPFARLCRKGFSKNYTYLLEFYVFYSVINNWDTTF